MLGCVFSVHHTRHDKRGGAADQDRNARRACGATSQVCDTSHIMDLALPDLESTVCFCMFMGCMHESCMHGMLVSPARRRSGLDSTRRDGRGVAPAALNVVRSGRQPIVALEPNPSPDRAPTVLGADCGTTEIGHWRVNACTGAVGAEF